MIGRIRENKIKYGLAASVAFVTFLVYLPALRHEFVIWDDSRYIVGNTHIRSFDLNLFRWAFFDFYAANWHPLTWISHALDYAIWGLSPMGHHLTNNILHALNTFLVVLLVVRLIEAAHDSSASADPPGADASRFTLITAAVTGLLFGLHPIHVESVAWVAERKDLLCAFFFLLSVLSYTKYVTGSLQRAESKGQRVVSSMLHALYAMRYALCFFILALLSKPMAVSLPVVLLLLDWYPFQRIQSLKTLLAAVMEKLPFIALSIVSAILTILAQKAGGAVQSLEFAPLSVRLYVASQALLLYLWKMIMPLNLVPYYPYPRNVSPLSLKYLFVFALVLGITAACLTLRKKNKIPVSVWGYYLVTLLPVLGIVQVGGQAMADRYAYLPSLGPFLLAGLMAAWFSVKLYTVKKQALPAKIAGVSASFVVLFFLTSLTLRQIAVWKNTFTLWDYVIEKDPDRVPEAYNNRGLAFSDKGQLNDAVEDYTKAIAINPLYREARLNRAVAYTSMGLIDKAIDDYTVVIVSRPFDQVFYLRGTAFEKKGQNDRALEDYKQALVLNPSYLEAYIRLGILYGKAGDFGKAIDQFNQAVKADPNYSLAYGNRGFAYSLMGRYKEALRDLDKAIELDRSYGGAYVNRGRVYLKMGDKEKAASDFREACALGEKEGCKARE